MCLLSRPSGGGFWEVGISKPKTAVASAKQTDCPVDLGWGPEPIPRRGRLRWELGMALLLKDPESSQATTKPLHQPFTSRLPRSGRYNNEPACSPYAQPGRKGWARSGG